MFWVLTIIYASPNISLRKKLWNYLQTIRDYFKGSWMIVGDFNEITCNAEKRGGRAKFSRSGFAEWIHKDNLMDMGFIGQNFTWMTRRGIGEEIWERLDRALCSPDWRLLYGEGFVKHLPRINSDHCPLLMSLTSRHIPEGKLKPFRFEAMWLKHSNFNEVVSNNWCKANVGIKEKVDRLTEHLRTWKYEVFGYIFKNKRRIMARLQGVQNCLSRGFKTHLAIFEQNLANEYNKIIEQEELFWLQKSRNCWLKEGDRNTKFFHLSTLVRRRHNKLEGLKDTRGMWTVDKEAIKNIAVNYFKDLFKSNNRDCDYDSIPRLFQSINDREKAYLNSKMSLEEVKISLFGIWGMKAPGPDGYSAAFYHHFWDMCKSDLYTLVDGCFEAGRLKEKINQTLITLIPKVTSPLDMTQLRPISLYNMNYKVISKVIVQRLRGLLPNLISPNQVAFVPGR
ncbi:hypothetical protein ACOSQ2_022819 [Xanthoceras sorbifolium]